MRNSYIVFIGLMIGLISACNSDQKTTTASEEHEAVPLTSPDFNADSAYAYVKAQVDFGPRIPGT
ncbi:MAG: glutamine cyclotransferase, partial [Chitinophagaceae bacterium]